MSPRPLTGRVGLRQVDPGNYVTPGDANGLVTMTEIKPISVIFTLSEDNYSSERPALHAGATIPVDAYDSNADQEAGHRAPRCDRQPGGHDTGTFRLRAIFPNEDEALFPNEFVNVRMLLDVDRDVIVIPLRRLSRARRESTSMSSRPRRQGASPSGHARADPRGAVGGGLGPGSGEKVVVDGADRLKEGGRVTVQQAGGRGPRQPRSPEQIK